MAIFRRTLSIAAGATEVNLLAGSKFEFLSRPSAVTIWATQDTAIDDIEIDLTLGNVVVAEDINPNVATVAGVINRNTDGVGSGVGDAGDRIQLRARNTDGAAARVVNALVEISEIA